MQILLWMYIYIIIGLLSPNAFSALKKPTVMISVLARNKAHTLPYFLTSLQNLNYPKDRISLWIRTDNNVDRTAEILKNWISSVKSQYHEINFELETEISDFGEKGPADWTEKRFKHIIDLRETALNYARKTWSDYFLTIDCDVFLTNKDTLNYLISKNVTVVSPMLKSEGLYSNFWFGMTDDYYYQRTEDYKPVLERQNVGCFEVPMVHSSVLINLNKLDSDYLSYIPERVKNYNGPLDDIIIFAISANRSHVPLNLCNEELFGYVMVPLEQDDKLNFDLEQLTNIKLEAIADDQPLEVTGLLKHYTSIPSKDTMVFDKIFMINLERRPERREKMFTSFDELGLNVTIMKAVDGRLLDENSIREITFLPEYADPYHKRPMTLGEVGCFLSHYNIWKEIVTQGYQTTLILEDDIRFEPFFKMKVSKVMAEANRIGDWDLVYFGRKRLQEEDEPFVEGSTVLVEVGYSYWTLGYALSLQGAKKLLDANPLSKLVPVDEYLPILFDKHPEVNWKGYFPNRNLKAFSAAPLLLHPMYYTGEPGYVSDTEDSVTIKQNVQHEDL